MRFYSGGLTMLEGLIAALILILLCGYTFIVWWIVSSLKISGCLT